MENKPVNKRIQMLTTYSIAELVSFMNREKITQKDVLKLGEFKDGGHYYLIYEKGLPYLLHQ